MRFIPTALHGVVDYAVGMLLTALPLYLGWSGMPRVALVALGIFVIAYSALTDYELGVIRFLRVRFHLFLDALVGAALLAIAATADLPQPYSALLVAIGVVALVLVATTKVRAIGSHSEADQI
ncbi:MAG: hypothetical protein NT113_06270 [Hyphomicrobiales bacterium]|jgi:hypothetical protein|nr:hypothetical protein [Hyphomicrobiales bacterium]